MIADRRPAEGDGQKAAFTTLNCGLVETSSVNPDDGLRLTADR
jgi:hypothetical protein